MRKASRQQDAGWALEVFDRAPYVTVSMCRPDGTSESQNVAIIEQAFFVKDNLAKLSSQSIDFVKKYHNYTSVASTYVKLYEKLLASSN